jgi:NAD(P)-dependent dehydrogenase (short-subunit alcohol dehydrogenase family)
MANVAISGANRGIGLELARVYSEAGDRVFAFCRLPKDARALNDLAATSDKKIMVHEMDVADGDSVAEAVAVVGEAPIDVLINNAGIMGTPQTLEATDFDVWVDVLKINTIGPFRVTQAFLPNIRKSAAPKVVTVTSYLGSSDSPHGGYYIYASSKAAVNKVTQALAIDLRNENISVSMIHPGWVRTDMGGPGGDLTPKESATGVHRVIAGLRMQDTGKFFNWNGEVLPR